MYKASARLVVAKGREGPRQATRLAVGCAGARRGSKLGSVTTIEMLWLCSRGGSCASGYARLDAGRRDFVANSVAGCEGG